MAPTTEAFADLSLDQVADLAETLEWAVSYADDTAANGKSVSDCFFGSLVSALSGDPEDDDLYDVTRKARIHVAAVAYKKCAFELQIAAAKYIEGYQDAGIARILAMLQTIARAATAFRRAELALIALTSTNAVEEAKIG